MTRCMISLYGSTFQIPDCSRSRRLHWACLETRLDMRGWFSGVMRGWTAAVCYNMPAINGDWIHMHKLEFTCTRHNWFLRPRCILWFLCVSFQGDWFFYPHLEQTKCNHCKSKFPSLLMCDIRVTMLLRFIMSLYIFLFILARQCILGINWYEEIRNNV